MQRADYTYKNALGQEVTYDFEFMGPLEWMLHDEVYKWVYRVRLNTEFGGHDFAILFRKESFPAQSLCEKYLAHSNEPYLMFEPWLADDLVESPYLGIALPDYGDGFAVMMYPRQ